MIYAMNTTLPFMYACFVYNQLIIHAETLTISNQKEMVVKTQHIPRYITYKISLQLKNMLITRLRPNAILHQ